MNKVDHFAVDKLLKSECEYLSRIGTILYHCNGKLSQNELDEIAKLLVIVDEEMEKQLVEIESLEELL